MPPWLLLLLLLLGMGGWMPALEDPTRASTVAASDHPGFNRDVRAILAENCFACHGPDANRRKAGLALQSRESALGLLASGATAIVPGNPAGSALIQRISSADPDQRMPPQATGKQLSPSQIQTLVRWIQDGAAYQQHWAYLAPASSSAPAPPDAWVRSGIDAWILDRLEHEGLEPAPEADRTTLIRRLSFDLTGLPPSSAEVNAFLIDQDPEAYTHLVDRLLASPRYGERMAVWWLDLVRYADSVGYHGDNPRNASRPTATG